MGLPVCELMLMLDGSAGIHGSQGLHADIHVYRRPVLVRPAGSAAVLQPAQHGSG